MQAAWGSVSSPLSYTLSIHMQAESHEKETPLRLSFFLSLSFFLFLSFSR